MLHHDLVSELTKLMLLILKNFICLVKVSLRLLIFSKNFFHGEEFSTFSDINIKDECIDADHLLVESQGLSPDGNCCVLKPSND